MNINPQKLINWLKDNSIHYEENLEIKYRSWIKAGGIIKFYINPDSKEQCQKLILYFSQNNSEFYVLGNMSNIIIRDGSIYTPIINLSKLNNIEDSISNGFLKLKIGCGVSIPRFAKFVINKGYSGTEGLLGIPGSLGGGIYMNSSSYESYISKYLIGVNVIDKKGKSFYLSNSELNFSWRKSILHETKFIACSCEFAFPKKNNLGIKKTKINALNIMNHRRKFQEDIYPNLGSIFATKNIYKDLSKVSLSFYLLFIVNKIFSIIVFNFFKSKIKNYRKLVISVYKILLGLDKFKGFSVSDKTLNCLINKGEGRSSEAITLLELFDQKTKYKLKMENIILNKIN